MQSKQNKLFFIIIGLIAAGLIYLLEPILTPFLIGALLAYLSDPLVEKMVSWKIPRLLSVIIVFLSLFLLIVLLILFLIPIIENQIVLLATIIPKIIVWSQTILMPWIKEHFGIEQNINVETIKSTLEGNWMKAGGIATWMLQTILHSGIAIVALITNLVLIPVVTFYLLRDWNIIIKNARGLLPRHVEPEAVKLATECNHTLSAFFRGQFMVMLSLGAIYSIGLTVIGLQLGFLIGLISGLVSIVPYLGFIVGIVSASIVSYMQFGSLDSIIWVWVVFAIGQSCESMFLTPKLVGDRIGLHPVAVIFAVLAGGMLFGFFGVLLALPVASVIMVWLRYLNQRYRASKLYK